MSSGLELTPAQLDRLEDALEDLELGPVPTASADDPVGQRLVEFHDLLQLSREALPMEDVPAGLLDGVMAEATAAAAMAPAKTESSLWSRLKLGVWLPTLAFAGSAALLLVVLLPSNDDAAAVATATQPAEAPLEQARPDAAKEEEPRLAARIDSNEAAAADPFGVDGAARGEAVNVGERAPDPAPPTDVLADDADAEKSEDAQAAEPAAAPVAKPKPMPKSKSKGNSSPAPSRGSGSGAMGGSKKGGGALPPSKPSKPSKKKDAPGSSSRDDDLWQEVDEGDALRRRGNCGLAKMRYSKARRAEQSAIRARALAGQGLCEYAAGEIGKAKKLFAQARAADPGVDGFINAQLAALPADRAQYDQADESPVQTKE